MVKWWRTPALALALVGLLANAAAAKKYRYDSGPPAPSDTTFSVATADYEPITRARGPKVPLTNFQVIQQVARTAYGRALASCPVDSGGHLVLAPSEGHPLNFMVEHAVLQALAGRAVSVSVRRSVIPDDSLASVAPGGDPVLEYQLASARITYLRLVGWLPGRVKIERQGLVEGTLTLRDPRTASILWTQSASFNLVDQFPRNQLPLVEDPRFSELKSDTPGRSIDKVVEPIIVIAIVTGLVLLFFQNRP
jgi:hypothetical protein